MRLSLFDYDLPTELVAQFPAGRRADSRMLVLHRDSGRIIDSHFRELTEIIDKSYFLILNDSRVFKARLFARRQSGGKVEVFLVRRLAGIRWLALLRPSGRIKAGENLYFDGSNHLTVLDDPGAMEREIEFPSNDKERYIISRFGLVPLPPYIKRLPEKRDVDRYQTVYAQNTGSVAAPTAGLHFDRRMLNRLREGKIDIERVTLHIGPGTFKPVNVNDIEEHYVDPEYGQISAIATGNINRHREGGKKLLAVGTTTVRTIESAADGTGRLPKGFRGMIDLFIYPSYSFKAVDAMLTNFHLPKSSLLMLVAAFCGRELILQAYRHAIERKYRFYSYGDCMLIL